MDRKNNGKDGKYSGKDIKYSRKFRRKYKKQCVSNWVVTNKQGTTWMMCVTSVMILRMFEVSQGEHELPLEKCLSSHFQEVFCYLFYCALLSGPC